MTTSWPERLRRALLPLLLACWPTARAVDELQPDAGCQPLVRAAPVAARDLSHPRGLLWRVQGATGGASYLLGTMHIGDPRVMTVAERARPQFDAARRFVLEVVLDEHAMQQLGAAMFYSDGRKLSEVAGQGLFAATEQRLADYGIAGPLADAIKPWAAFTTLSLPVKGAAALPLDLALLGDARAAGKEVVGLETVDEQVAVFEGLAEREQLDMLREVVCHYATFQGELGEMVEAYAARDLATLVEQSERYANSSKDQLMERLLWKRNARMAERIAPLVDAGGAFIAVGALHLPGERGLLSLLEARGYRVERVY